MLPLGLPDEFYEEELRKFKKEAKKDKLFYDFLSGIGCVVLVLLVLTLVFMICVMCYAFINGVEVIL